MDAALTIEKKLSPVLIVDKEGIIGEALIKRLQEEALIIFISKKQLEDSENIIFIPFQGRPATIPDNSYFLILVVDDQFSWVRSSLSSFAKKADEDKSKFIFITDLNQKDDKLIEEISRFHRAKTLILGDIFNEESLAFKTLTNNFIHQAREEGRIDVPGDGTESFYPVSFTDTIAKITEIIFTDDKTALNYIFAKTPFSYLSFAHTIQKEHPFIKIDFVRNEEEKKEALNDQGKFVLGDTYPLKIKIKAVKIANFKKDKAVNPKQLNTPIDSKKTKQRNRLFLRAIGCLLLLILLPAILTFSTLFIGAKSLQASLFAMAKGDLREAINYSSFAQKQFLIADFSSKPLLLETNAIGLTQYIIPFLEKIELGISLAKTETAILNLLSLISADNLKDGNKIELLINDVKYSLQKYHKQAALNPNSIKETEKYTTLLNFAFATSGVWEDLLGVRGKRKYLVLFQNNMELRPGGGFIGSYAILTLDKGKIEFKIHDVYDADGQLKGHIEPPFPIRRYLGKVHWYLRDSNFDVSFPKSAATSAYFLNLETGEKVNGVIGVDVSFLKNLMEAIGPVYVSDYKENVNTENIFYLTESYAEKDFFPGSSQKKDFLRSLFNELQFKLTKDKKIPYLAVLASLEKSLNEKHLLFTFSEQSIQEMFSANNWSSAIPTQAVKKDTVYDFLGINEANLGMNKTNYFVTRSITKAVSVSETGEITSTLALNYKNSSDGKWPGGDYINYLRIIVPQGSEIDLIEIDGKAQELTPAITNFLQYEAKTFKPPTGLEVEKYSEEGKAIFGFLFNTPAGKSKTVKINYKLAEKINPAKIENNYNFYFFKQPGIDNIPVNFSLKLADNLKFAKLSRDFTKIKNQVTASFNATTDHSKSLKIGRK